jgi:hypothetical protein
VGRSAPHRARGPAQRDARPLLGLLLGAGLDRDVAAELALAVNQTRCKPPLDPGEVERIATSLAGRERRKTGGQR